MRAIPVLEAVLAGLCVTILAGCSSSPTNPASPDGAASAEDNKASVMPPSLLTTQSNLPAASTFYPTGRPSVQPSSAGTKTTQGSTTRSGTSSRGGSTDIDGSLPGGAAAPVSKPDPVSDQVNSANGMDGDSTFDNLDLMDASLKGKLAVLRVGSEPTANNLLSVFAGLKNKTSRPMALEVQTIYKDSLGNPLNEGSWIPLNLKPHEETEYRSASISSDATDFVVRVRRTSTSSVSGGN